MSPSSSTLPETKRIALIAHDNRKVDLLEWARFNRDTLARHHLVATGTTGGRVQRELGLDVQRFQSGPLGGDQQVGARIAEGVIDMVVFFWDPLQPLPHDVDVKALLRLAVVYNIPTACNRATADFLISSPLMTERYDRRLVDYESRVGQAIAGLDAEPAPAAAHQSAIGFGVSAEQRGIDGHATSRSSPALTSSA